MKRKFWVISLLCAILLVLLIGMTAPAFAAPLKGAIFTTTANGSIVNENVHYNAKIDVYLDGGPPPNAPQTAAGLPDGDYVFQVTNPSGSVLLSSDAARCRVVRVAGGVIVALRDWLGGTTFVDHTADDPCHRDGKSFGKHDTATDIDHGPPAIVVQLMPFLDTPNPGGVYKAWITPVAAYLAKGGRLDSVPNRTVKLRGQTLGFQPDPGFGPSRDQVKTDNFKVKEFFPPEIRVRKFNDLNGNTCWEPGEPEIGVNEYVDDQGNVVPASSGGGWPFSVLDPNGVTNYYFTPQTIVDGVGDYYVTEGMFSHWRQTAAYRDGVKLAVNQTVMVTLDGISGEKHEVIFGNVHLGSVKVHKFHDRDHDGQQGAGEEGLSGWEFTLYKADGVTKVTTNAYGNPITNPKSTDANGNATWEDLMPGTYVIKETPRDHWLATTGASKSLTINSGAMSTVDFGNVHLGSVKVHKFHDRDHDGQQGAGEEGLSGWEFTLYKADGVTKVTTNAYGNPITNPKSTDANGNATWEDLMPGTYVIKETPRDHWRCTTGPARTVMFESCTAETTVDFGNIHLCEIKVRKFFDSNRDGIRQVGEVWLPGWEFTIYEADGTTKITRNALGDPLVNPQTTDQDGWASWKDLLPGTYVVKETLRSGWISTTNPTQTVTTEVGETEIAHFGNFRGHGLTPGFWKNWRNHFSRVYFQNLLSGTIASSIAEADAIFEYWQASPDNELTTLKAFLLADQLTLNLGEEWPENPYGWLAPYLGLDGVGQLQDAISAALDILANPRSYTRDQVLIVKNKLEAFATLN